MEYSHGADRGAAALITPAPSVRLTWGSQLATADRVYYNATIHTSDGPRASAIALAGNRILATGDDDAMRALAGPHAVQRNLRGRTVIPGLIDSHNHLLQTGLNAALVDLARAETIGDVLAALVERARSSPAEWVVSASNWHESQLRERRFPSRAELDVALPDRPLLIRRGGHNVVVNSVALAQAGITDRTPDPPGGTYVRDSEGHLSGHVIGLPAFAPIARLAPQPDEEELLAAIRRAMRLYNAAGLTGVIEPGLGPAEMRAYLRLREQGELSVRTVLMPRVEPATTEAAGQEALRMLEALPLRTNFGDAVLKIGGIKIVADGGVETNYLREPYAFTDDPASPRGKPRVSPENLAAVCRAANRLGWQLGIHCVGDAAIDLVLDAYAAADAERSIADRRWTLIHMTLARPEHLKRARALHLALAVQQPLIYALGSGWVKYWGPQRAEQSSPMRAYLESGLIVGGGSDSPVSPYQPLLGIESCVTRATRLAGVLGPQWRITPAEALRIYTRGSAACSFDERQRGTLVAGTLADLVVLGADPLRVNPEEIASIPVEETIVDGRVVFGAEA